MHALYLFFSHVVNIGHITVMYLLQYHSLLLPFKRSLISCLMRIIKVYADGCQYFWQLIKVILLAVGVNSSVYLKCLMKIF